MTCQTCGDQLEVPTPDTRNLPTVGGFVHPNTVFTNCPDCTHENED